MGFYWLSRKKKPFYFMLHFGNNMKKNNVCPTHKWVIGLLAFVTALSIFVCSCVVGFMSVSALDVVYYVKSGKQIYYGVYSWSPEFYPLLEIPVTSMPDFSDCTFSDTSMYRGHSYTTGYSESGRFVVYEGSYVYGDVINYDYTYDKEYSILCVVSSENSSFGGRTFGITCFPCTDYDISFNGSGITDCVFSASEIFLNDDVLCVLYMNCPSDFANDSCTINVYDSDNNLLSSADGYNVSSVTFLGSDLGLNDGDSFFYEIIYGYGSYTYDSVVVTTSYSSSFNSSKRVSSSHILGSRSASGHSIGTSTLFSMAVDFSDYGSDFDTLTRISSSDCVVKYNDFVSYNNSTQNYYFEDYSYNDYIYDNDNGIDNPIDNVVLNPDLITDFTYSDSNITGIDDLEVVSDLDVTDSYNTYVSVRDSFNEWVQNIQDWLLELYQYQLFRTVFDVCITVLVAVVSFALIYAIIKLVSIIL